MSHPLPTHSRRAYALLGTAAIVLGGAVAAYSTQQAATPLTTPERDSTEQAKTALTDTPLQADVEKDKPPDQYKSSLPPSRPRLDASPDGPQLPLQPEKKPPEFRVKVSPQVIATASAGQGAKRLEELLDGIDHVDRDERFRRWMEIFEFTEVDPAVVKKLEDVATGRSPAASRYVRFVAAANTGGFGLPNHIGPNSVRHGKPLGIYINGRRMMPIPPSMKGHIEVAPPLENLIVVVPPNADNSLYFQEILWTILEKYHLDFRTEADGTFMIVPEKPPV
jgi:hypothetical protein